MKVLQWYLPGETEIKNEIRISGALAEIRTKLFPNTSLGRYRYATLFGLKLLNIVTCRAVAM
jgi:hypothetical protein